MTYEYQNMRIDALSEYEGKIMNITFIFNKKELNNMRKASMLLIVILSSQAQEESSKSACILEKHCYYSTPLFL
jgi:hypothetical protein